MASQNGGVAREFENRFGRVSGAVCWGLLWGYVMGSAFRKWVCFAFSIFFRGGWWSIETAGRLTFASQIWVRLLIFKFSGSGLVVKLYGGDCFVACAPRNDRNGGLQGRGRFSQWRIQSEIPILKGWGTTKDEFERVGERCMVLCDRVMGRNENGSGLCFEKYFSGWLVEIASSLALLAMTGAGHGFRFDCSFLSFVVVVW